MPVAAAIAAALTDHSAHPYSLEVGSLDVLKEPNAPGWGVSVDTIEVTEAGPGAVSSMTFVIDDPEQSITISGPLGVLFKANDGASPETIYFRGWVDGVDVVPAFGGQGRLITVRCSGIEQLLDWFIVPTSFSMGFATLLTKYVGILAQTFAPLLQRTGTDAGTAMVLAPWTRNGSFNYPMGNLVRPAEPAWALNFFSTWTGSGTTLRNSILDLAAHCSYFDSVTAASDHQGVGILLTVDWWYGLRLWEDNPALQPDDYTTLTVTDTYAGTNVAANLRYAQDFAGVNRSAYVIGSGGTDYGVTSDGSGIVGRMLFINDSLVTSDAVARARALGSMDEDSATYRGDFLLENFTPPTTVHAGSLISITDAATSLSATHRITEIHKTFLPNGLQNWNVTFGGLPRPRVSRLMRRYTRSTF